MPEQSVQCVVTSPPYWGLRDYGVDGQLGLESTPDEYLAGMVDVFRAVRRVLRDDGTCWVNLGSSYASSQSLPPVRAPSCGSENIESQGSTATGSACCDPDGGRSVDSQSRHGRTVGNDQPSQRVALPPSPIVHDSERSDSLVAAPSLLDVLASTTSPCMQNAQGASDQEGRGEERRNETRSSPGGAPSSACKDESIDDMLSQLRTLVDRIEGTEPSALASAYYSIASRGFKSKDLIDMPHMLATALRLDGWYVRSHIIWAKPNPMPESVTDRPTKSHEYMFLLTKRPRYFYDADAVRERQKEWLAGHGGGMRYAPGRSARGAPRTSECVYNPSGRNLHDVWNIPTEAYAEAHFATFPRRLVEPCIKAGTSDKGCCPECGAPWKRIVTKDRQATRPGLDNVNDATGMANRDNGRHVTESTTVGWEPGCKCVSDDGTWVADTPDEGHPIPFEPRPCLVLDPFAGSGTTGVVAKQLGRSFIGCELNPKYAEMARRRIANSERLPDVVDVPGQLTMFG